MKRILILIMAYFIVMTIGCSKATRASKSVLDSPEMHISRGLKYFNNEQYEEAKKEFDDAIFIEAKKEEKAGAYAGLGMYFAVKGDNDKAEDNAEKAVSLDKKLPLVHTCFGRTITLLNKGKDADEWIDDAFEEFDDAIEYADEKRDVKAKAEAFYFKGIAAKSGYKFSKAKKAFSKVVELKSLYAMEANKQWEIVQMIERAKPGTKVGAKVALMEKVGKAEIAVLFVEEMKIKELLKKKEKKSYDNSFQAPEDLMKLATEKIVKMKDAVDIEKSWARSWINDVISIGVMEAEPDHKFYPNKKITRAEYSMILIRVLALITGDEKIYTKYFGEPNSRFKDMRTSHAAYNAASVCVNRGIMKANLSGEFRKGATVSGAEALLIIREFQNALTMTF